jgi:hypothetical protein
LPAEIIRKGRFDEVFFVDLPDDEERPEIFKVHLSGRSDSPLGVWARRSGFATGKRRADDGAERPDCPAPCIRALRRRMHRVLLPARIKAGGSRPMACLGHRDYRFAGVSSLRLHRPTAYKLMLLERTFGRRATSG